MIDYASGSDKTVVALITPGGTVLPVEQLAPALAAWSRQADVRQVYRRGRHWYCARDIHEQFGIAWKGRAGSLRGLPEWWVDTWEFETAGGLQELLVINAEAVLRIALRSRRPPAAALLRRLLGQPSHQLDVKPFTQSGGGPLELA